MRDPYHVIQDAGRGLLILALVAITPPALAQPRGRPAPAPPAAEPLPLPPPAAPSTAAPATTDPVELPPPSPPLPGVAPVPPVAAPPIAAPRPVAAPRQPRLQRRIGLPELGLPAGLAFGAPARDLMFPLPRGIAGLGARLVLEFELSAPFPGRHAVRITANDRVLESRAFPDASDRLTLELEVPPEDLARMDGLLHLQLRLVSDPPGESATATLRTGSHLALLLPPAPELGVAALFRLLPRQTQVLLRPGPVSPAEAAAALRIGLALARTGRQVSIGSNPPGRTLAGADGSRIWDTGAVLVGPGAEAASVRIMDGQPVLVLGGAEPDRAAGLLDSAWQDSAIGSTIQGGLSAPADPVATARPATLALASLRGSTAPQAQARANWTLEFSTRDLPAGTWPEAIEAELRAAPDPAGGRAVASLLLNQTLLGTATLSAEGQGRLAVPVPQGLVALENRLEVVVQRNAATGPAQMLPGSVLRLGVAPPARDFLALPPAFAAGVQVLVDAPGGALVAEQLNPLLWVLRGLVPPAAPLTVVPVVPESAAQPSGPFIAATLDPPAGTAPVLRFDAGRVVLSSGSGRPLLDLSGLERVMAVQLLDSEGHPGLWLRRMGALPLLPASAPLLDRGDVALLDGQGVALAWNSAPSPVVRVAYPDAASGFSLRAWRPWIVGVLWIAGFALVVYAFARPRRTAKAKTT
ncbi:hypothetical protein ACLF3G_01600 [Falsiroseomonas sp. HC035]|uniref:hypothetical protein n=1 Tax=Falsiroseomonas sp. HC035 TaxID=3390999 RepID=UPI003D31BFB9